jgi:hypothetical protein
MSAKYARRRLERCMWSRYGVLVLTSRTESALGTSIRSDLTGASGVEGYTFPALNEQVTAGWGG